MAIFKTKNTLYKYERLQFGELYLMTPINNINPYMFSALNANSNPFAGGDFTSCMASIFSSLSALKSINTTSFSPMAFNMPIFNMSNFNFGNFTMPKFDFSNFNYGSTTRGNGSSRPNVKLTKSFLNKVKQVAQRIGCNYKDLLAVMNSESGLNSRAQNKKGGASGLIQFMPATARALGTTTDALREMTPEQQLDYVEKFYLMNRRTYVKSNRQLSAGDLYTLTFLPAYVNQEVLTSQGHKFYNANKGLDVDGDGHITKSDLAQRVARKQVDESIFA